MANSSKIQAKRYERIVKLATEGIWTVDENGLTDFINEQGAAILGYRPEEMLGRPLTDFVYPEDREMLERAPEMTKQGESGRFEVLMPRKDGSEVWLLVSTSPMIDEDGRFHGALSMATDITERKRYEEELRRSNAELQQFAYVASHDLQEPLRMVTMYLGLLTRKFGDELPPQAKEYMCTAVEGSLRMKQLIDDLLEYSRIGSRAIEIAEVDMNRIMEEVKDDLHVTIAESGAEVFIDALPAVCADEGQMKQLLTNLVSNAVKFRGAENPRVIISVNRVGNVFVFSVEDNGIGIDPRHQDKLFKMFSRLHTRDEYPGTGIGLAIAKKIVERHGGRIWFYSEPGKGTTFFFTIPASGMQ